MPIGLSTHSLGQLQEAIQHDPLYVGFGPVYPTTTKANPDPTVGVQQLSEAVRLSTVPVVAIGGIFPENIDTIVGAGAKNLSLVRHLMSEDAESRIADIQALLAL